MDRIDSASIDAFQRDGAVVLRGVFTEGAAFEGPDFPLVYGH
jgi:hypothetical protein